MPKLPDNINRDNLLIQKKIEILQDNLPDCISDFFMFISNKALLTQRDYLLYLCLFFDYLVKESLVSAECVKDITLDDIAEIDHRAVNKFLYDTRYRERGDDRNSVYNSPRTIAKKRTAIVQFFKLAYREKWIKDDITNGFNKIKVNQNDRVIKFLEENEIMDLFDVVETGYGLTDKERVYWEKTKYRDTAIITLFVVAALREQELRQLNVSSFDWKHEEFTIFRKRGKIVHMPINNRIRQAVRDYIDLERPDSEDDALFLSSQGKRISSRQLINIIKKYTSIVLGSSRAEGFSPHKLRATAATSLVRRGIDIYEIKEYLDHDNVATTQIYAHLGDNIKKEISKEMEFDLNYKDK